MTTDFETIQDIAIKMAKEQKKIQTDLDGPKERYILVLGSANVGKSTLINHFLDRTTTVRPTLALDYAYGRRSGTGHSIQRNVCHVWECGSLANGIELISAPLACASTITLPLFTVAIVVDLSQTATLWRDISLALHSLATAIPGGTAHNQLIDFKPFPFRTVIVGGKYDLFQNKDPEIKKHVCRLIRSVAHIVGAAVLFYSEKNASLVKMLRDTCNHFAYGSPTNPFRTKAVDYNAPIVVPIGADSWEEIGTSAVATATLETVGLTFAAHIPQDKTTTIVPDEGGGVPDPATEAGFTEAVIDELRQQKTDELVRRIALRSNSTVKFEIIDSYDRMCSQ